MNPHPADSPPPSSPSNLQPAAAAPDPLAAEHPPSGAADCPTTADLRAAAHAQLREIEKYQWCLGVKLGYDPLLDRTRAEICAEWIEMHAAAFRAWWDGRARDRHS